MHPADIQAAIKKAGHSQAAIAAELRVSRMAVSHIIHGRGKSRRIASRIAQLVAIPLSDLWPGMYQERLQ
jgi:lambda repressor-like predicted transcriptional regulator